jgi:hypothetical protein
MKTDELDDLKQFMTALISQTEIRLGDRIDSLEVRFDKLEGRLDGLAADMKSGFDGIANIIEAHNTQLDDHEERLTKLEQQAA